MKKNQIRKSVAALAMAVVVGVSLLGYGCGSKSASTAGGVSGDFTGTAKGMGGDVTVTLTLEDGKITGCTAEGKDETPGIGTLALEQLPAQIAETGSIAVDGVSTATITSNAIKEAKLFGEVDVVASSEDTKFNYIPKHFVIPTDADYFHYTSNNTIYGTELRKDPDSPVPMVCDMSSDIFSRVFDPTKYEVIYAGAQKNLAPAGVTIVIVKESALGHVSRPIPTMLDYRTHVKKGSMFNTPPVLPIYSALMTLRYYKEQGGVAEMERRDLEKAAILYDEIDRNKLFMGTVAEEDRSIMNVCFVMKPDYAELEKEFLDFATSKGMVGIKGHRSVGGFRASLYNALPKESVEALVAVMKEFEAKH